MSEEDAYEQVAAEVSQGDLKRGLWAKALAESVGNENVAKSLYLKFRAQQLLSERRFEKKEKAKQEFQTRVAAAKHRTGSAVWRGFLAIIIIVCGSGTLVCALGFLIDITNDSKNGPDVVGAVVSLAYALFFGVATVVCARAMRGRHDGH